MDMYFLSDNVTRDKHNIPIAGIFTARVVVIDGRMAIQQTSGYNDVSNYENVSEKLFKSFVLFHLNKYKAREVTLSPTNIGTYLWSRRGWFDNAPACSLLRERWRRCHYVWIYRWDIFVNTVWATSYLNSNLYRRDRISEENFDLSKAAQRLRKNLVEALPGFHCFTGNDHNAALVYQGKATPFQKLKY